MMALVLTLLTLSSLVCSEYLNEESVPLNTAYGYLKNFAIPEAELIRKAEAAYPSQSRIVGGVPASPGQYPYQAGLILSITDLTDVGICGGTIISENRVLTAAHCWYDGIFQVWKVTVILGSVTLFSGGVRIESSEVVVHPNWDPNLVRNDIAIIYLPSSLPLSAYIAPISLPSGNELNEDFVGSKTISSGFGLTNDRKDDTITNYMQLNSVPMSVIDNKYCHFAFPLLIQPSNICTVNFGGGSACRGDSGGPLVVQRNDRSILIGVTSFGSTLGCLSGLPDVYTRVTSFISFINENL